MDNQKDTKQCCGEEKKEETKQEECCSDNKCCCSSKGEVASFFRHIADFFDRKK